MMTPQPDFIDVKLSRTTLDRALIRSGIFQALSRAAAKFHGTLLDVGCGQSPYKSLLLGPESRVTRYLGLDLRSGAYAAKFGPFDLEWDGSVIPLNDRSVDCAIATEVLEQCPAPEAVLGEIARVLKPGGIFFFTVPFLWPIHDPPHDQYRFTHFALERQLRGAGFVDIELRATGGWDASLAQMIGLWVRRRPMGRVRRRVLSSMATPLVRMLASMDRPPPLNKEPGNTLMITGISGTAVLASVNGVTGP
jgi:SAM-dependent methyltransferase